MSDQPEAAAAASRISERSPLVFMHIPKTGGMSFFTACTALWGTAIADLYNDSPRNPAPVARAIADRGKALYCGHYAFGLHEWFDRPVYYAAVLREPVARLVSLYHYCQPMLKHYRERLQKVGGDMAALAAQPNLSDFYLDFGPWLQGDQSAEAFFASPSAELENGMVRRFSGYGLNPAPCPASALELAKANIEKYFSVVGLLERYPETLQLMARSFGLPTLAENRVNANRSKPEGEDKGGLSPALMQRLREMNNLDLALYDWVSARFDAQLTQPRPAVSVPGGGRQDAAAMPLWRAVGQSPLREAAMKERGLPKLPKTQPMVCRQLTWAGYNERSIMVDLSTVTPGAAGEPGTLGSTRLVLDAATARRLAQALGKAIAGFEGQKGGKPA